MGRFRLLFFGAAALAGGVLIFLRAGFRETFMGWIRLCVCWDVCARG
jgi:hypothetical protein